MLLPLFLCHASFTSHAATSCYSDTECGPLSWCEIVGEPSSGGMYNCTSKPPPSGCKTYSVLDPGEQGECRYACYANPGGGPGPAICTSKVAPFTTAWGLEPHSMSRISSTLPRTAFREVMCPIRQLASAAFADSAKTIEYGSYYGHSPDNAFFSIRLGD